jgi:hypothetical protein
VTVNKGTRQTAKGSRRKQGLDVIIRFKVQRRLEFDRRENGNIGEKFQTANIEPYTFYLIPWTLESLDPQALEYSR